MPRAGRKLGGLIIHEYARSKRFLLINTGRNGMWVYWARRREQTQYYLIMAETFNESLFAFFDQDDGVLYFRGIGSQYYTILTIS